jgi:hypothetical protein
MCFFKITNAISVFVRTHATVGKDIKYTFVCKYICINNIFIYILLAL